MNLIFLDIDGVLCTARTNYSYFDPAAISNLNKIIFRANAGIVVTSSWRTDVSTLEEMRNIFRINGAIFGNNPFEVNAESIPAERIIGMTPYAPVFNGNRGLEIKEWCKQNKVKDRFIIIDDEDHDLQAYKNKLVRTDSLVGLTKLDVESALQLFGIQ